MRKLYITVAFVLIALTIQAQTVLNYKTHGLVADHVNEMIITKYTEPGSAGLNVVWDFRKLETIEDFTGTIDNPTYSKGCDIFTKSNSVLQEFGNFFFFNANEDGIEQHGYMSGNGNLTIVYDRPFVKMRYPFTYGNAYTGSFGGKYNVNEKQLGKVHGSYLVEADGMGTLILPGNHVYENALRVKEIKSYDRIINSRRHDIETITYRWYINGHRFPILVLISSTIRYDFDRIHTTTQAAYNPVRIKGESTPLDVNIMNQTSFTAYPNPYHNEINIRFDVVEPSNVNLSVFDINGRLVKVLVNGQLDAGEKNYKFSGKDMGLGAGAYLLKLNINGTETTKKILEQ